MIRTPIVFGEFIPYSPPVFRYMESKFIKEFFENCTLRLSSFAQFQKHKDEQRLDFREGESSFVNISEEKGGQTIFSNTSHRAHAYILSTSLSLDIQLVEKFSCDAVLKIRNPYQFCQLISKCIPGFRTALCGPCYYMKMRLFETNMGYLEKEWIEQNKKAFNEKALQHIGFRPFFIKSSEFSHQCEYRFVWITNEKTSDYIDICVPEARRICRMIQTDGIQLGNHVPKDPGPPDAYIKFDNN